MADGEDLGGGNGVKSDPLQDMSSNSTKLNGSPTKDSVPPKTQPPPEDAQKLTMTEPADQEAYQDPKMGVLANDSHADTADLEDEGEAAGIEMGMGMGAGKKKKKRKPKSKRGLVSLTHT